MSALVTCPGCNHEYTVPEDNIGRNATCKACGTKFALAAASLTPDKDREESASAPDARSNVDAPAEDEQELDWEPTWTEHLAMELSGRSSLGPEGDPSSSTPTGFRSQTLEAYAVLFTALSIVLAGFQILAAVAGFVLLTATPSLATLLIVVTHLILALVYYLSCRLISEGIRLALKVENNIRRTMEFCEKTSRACETIANKIPKSES